MTTPASGSVPEEDEFTEVKLREKVELWAKKLSKAAEKVSTPGPDKEPFKFIYAAIEDVRKLNDEVELVLKLQSVTSQPQIEFWVKFTHIHILSSLAKWNEIVEELSVAEARHIQYVTFY